MTRRLRGWIVFGSLALVAIELPRELRAAAELAGGPYGPARAETRAASGSDRPAEAAFFVASASDREERARRERATR